jgi:mutual gliding-motility protein MglA
MAFFDPERRCLTLRLVYDGLGTAGKTTNVRQAHSLFTLARSGEVFAPVEEQGRTLFFDWLELEAGVVEDHPLRCQVLTVPGQFLYIQRRYELLRTADAVVLVCDSTPAGVVRSRYAFRFLRRMIDEGACPPVPIIVQANKQDLPDAMRAEALAAELGLEPGTRVIEASAMTGEGVRATLVYALQAARDELRAFLDAKGLAALPTRRETPQQVYEHLLRHEEGDEGAELADAVIAGFFSEEKPGDLDDDLLLAPVSEDDDPFVEPAAEAVAALSGAPSAGAVSLSGAPSASAVSLSGAPSASVGPLSAMPTVSVGGPSRALPASVNGFFAAKPGSAGGASEAMVVEADENDELLPPVEPLPGSVWPSALGPVVVRDAVGRLVAGPRPAAGEVGGEVEVDAGGAWVLVTAPSLVFADESAAQFALEDMVRARGAAAELLPASTVFVLSSRSGGARRRLWAIRPAIAPLFDERAGLPADEVRRHEAVELLAIASARAAALAARRGIVLKVAPGRVGSSAGAPVYLGLIYGLETLDASFVDGMLRWVDRAGDLRVAERYGARLRRALRHHATPSDLSVIGFTSALDFFRPSTEAGARLVEFLRGS